MIIVRRRDPSFSGYSAVRVIVNDKEMTKLEYKGEQQFLLPPGIHTIYFKRSLAGKSNLLTLDVKSESDLIIVECAFNELATSISARIVSNHEEIVELRKASLASDFTPTKSISAIMEVDERKRLVAFLTGFLGIRGKNTKIYRYEDILEYELLENGSSVTKGGLGRAIAFGVLTGGVGAIVGGVTSQKRNLSVCDSLKLKITINDINNPAVFVDIITSKTKTDSPSYQSKYKSAQEALSLLNIICNSNETEKAMASVGNMASISSSADEIAKYKALLDNGAITIAEYEAKKKQFLDL